MNRRQYFFSFIFAAALFLTSAPTHAATNAWSGATDNNWTTAGNWYGTYAAGNTNWFTNITAIINFDSDTSTAGILLSGADPVTVTITNNQRTMTLSGGYGVNVQTGTLNLNVGTVTLGASQPWTVASGAALNVGARINTNAKQLTASIDGAGTFSGIISGTGSLTKSGAGILVLSGANTYTTRTTVNNGTLQLGANNALPFDSNLQPVSVIADAGVTATLNFNNYTNHIGALTLGGASTTSKAQVMTGTGTYTMRGNMTYDAANNPLGATISGNLDLYGQIRTFTVGDSSTAAEDLIVSAKIVHAGGSIVKAGAGVLTFSGANTYGGTTTVNAGTLQSGANNVLPDGSAITVSGNVAGVTATLNLNGYNDTIGSLTLGGATTTSGAAVMTGAGSLTISGSITYNSANNPLGATISGKLNFGSETRGFAIGDSSNAAADLTISANIVQTNGSITKTGDGQLTLSGTLTTTAGNGFNLINNGNGQLLISGVINGAGAVSNSGNGQLEISGGGAINGTLANTGTGQFLISGAISAQGTLASTGSGQLLVTGNITKTSGLTLKSDSGSLVVSGNISSQTGNSFFLAGTANGTISGSIGNQLAITKNGPGTWYLTGNNNTHVNAVNITAGVLNIQNAGALGSGNHATITSGAALQVQGGFISSSTGTLNLNGSGISSDGALRNISGNNTLARAIALKSASRINSDAGTLTIDVASGNAITGAFDLTIGGTGNVVVADPIATSTGQLIKDGTGVLKLSTVNTYTGGTKISGGVLNIANDNNLGGTSGTLTFDNGTLQFGASGITISASRPVTITSSGGYVDMLNSGTIDRGIGGSGGLTKTGVGRLTLTGANTYNGNTTVSGGELIVNGSLAASGAVNVNGGATLGGSGTVGAVTVASGGTLSPGNSAGVFNVGALTLQSGAKFHVQIDSVSSYDQVIANGAVDITGSTLVLDQLGYSPVANGTSFTILTNLTANSITGQFSNGNTITVNDLVDNPVTFTINYNADSVVLTAGVIPEPSTWALVALALVPLFFRRQRRL
jgi:autotransporter-associated beta strand protein